MRIGFLADTHSAKPDGSDLPDKALKAFEGVDLIVHLGDVGRKGILDRLGVVAPVLVPAGGGKGYVPYDNPNPAPLKVIEADNACVGVTFNLSQPDKKIQVDNAGITFPNEPLSTLLSRRFKREVEVVASAGTHRQHQQTHEGVLFFDPGSPTLPTDTGPAGVAVLDLRAKAPKVKLINWR